MIAVPGSLPAQAPAILAPPISSASLASAPPARLSPTGLDALLTSPIPSANPESAPATPTGLSAPATPIQLLEVRSPNESHAAMDSFVSQIAGAIPRNMLAFSFEAFYDLQQPARAEYLFAKPNLTNDSAFRQPETRLNYQEASIYAEICRENLSVFFDVPCRFLNPEVNSYRAGPGNTLWGVKYGFWTTDHFIATLMLRVFASLIGDPQINVRAVNIC